MATSLEAVYVALISTFWFILLFYLSYRYGPVLAKQNPPVSLPLVVFGWTLITIPSLVVWVNYKAVVGQVKTTSSWFVVGWVNKLNFFNIFIDTWWEYTVVMMYNIGRTVIGSLVTNVFRPLLLLQQSRILTSDISQTDAFIFVFGQAVITVFGFFSSITDIFLALTQVDVTMVALVVTLLMDGFATHNILSTRIRGRSKSITGGGATPGDGAVKLVGSPAMASAASWRRTMSHQPPGGGARGGTHSGQGAAYKRLHENFSFHV
jgi:hypothetical protein